MKINKIKTNINLFLILAVLFASVFASAVSPKPVNAAAICFVDDDAAGPSHDGVSWQTAYLSLQDAIASTDCINQIWVATGTYTPSQVDRTVSFVLKPGVEIYGGFAGTEALLEDRVLHIIDEDFNNDTILSGEIGDPIIASDNIQHILKLEDSNNTATRLDGFVIQGGYADDGTTAEGGGLSVINGTVTLSNLRFRLNAAVNKGGGLSSGFGHLTVEHAIFELNQSGVGGGLYETTSTNQYTDITVRNNEAGSGGGAYFHSSNSTVANSTFTGNDTSSGDGGGLVVDGGAPVFTGVTISGNLAEGSASSHGGGASISAAGTPTFLNSTISDNHSNADGGGVYNAGSALYRNVTISGNMAGTLDGSGNPVLTSMGGGMFITLSQPSLIGVRFVQNTAANMGGGISHSFDGQAKIFNCIFDGNRSVGGGGGGIEATGPHAYPVIVNSTFVNNHTVMGYGGGLFAHDGSDVVTVQVYNSIFWGNTRGETPVLSQIVRSDPSTLSVTYSDVQGGYIGTGNIDVNPLFTDIDGADNVPGNADDNLHVHWTSPVIDAGSNTAVPPAVTKDFDEHPRFSDMLNVTDTGEGTAPIVDMGAYEVQSPNIVVTKTASASTVPEGTTVTYTITVENSGFGTAHNLIISDPLPGNLERTSTPAISPPGAGTAGTAPILFNNITLAGGDSVTVTYDARGPDGPAVINNTVTVMATELPAPGISSLFTLDVANAAPAVNAGPNQVINEGVTANFTGVYTDPAGALDAPYTIRWTFSDSPDPVQDTLTTSRLYADNGSFTATLSVTDADGDTGSDVVNITVNNVPPTVNAGTDITANEGSNVAFHGTATDPGADPLTYAWNFDDGTPVVTGTLDPTHTFANDGVYDVTLTVDDGDGPAVTDTLVVTVNNVVPIVDAGSNQIVNIGAMINFHGSFVDPAGELDAPFTISWDFGDGGTASGTLTPHHFYSARGTFTVTLTVTDADGGVGTDTLTIESTGFAFFLPFVSARGGPN